MSNHQSPKQDNNNLQTSSQSKLKEIDLKICELSSIECNKTDKRGSIISCCSAVKRLCVGYIYHELLGDIDEDKMDLFVNFCVNVYQNQLNDWTHFIKNHSSNEELIEIGDELRITSGIKECDINTCNKIKRHYRQRRQENYDNNNDDEGMYAFYLDCYDRFHHHIFHLFHIGLRIKKTRKISDNNNNDDDHIFDFKWRMQLLWRMQKKINY